MYEGWLKDIRNSENANSCLKRLFVGFCNGKEKEQGFEETQAYIDQVLMFLNPDAFKEWKRVRSGETNILTPEQKVRLTGRVPALKVNIPKPKEQDNGSATGV